MGSGTSRDTTGTAVAGPPAGGGVCGPRTGRRHGVDMLHISGGGMHNPLVTEEMAGELPGVPRALRILR
ncbi:hypothetical protein [Streptomyces sp. NPDC020917]|uniref:hypothetical protein n=1 Tax=Streptomyces sp. NPDC020917 TaxID=3365102 RepID=UPI0037BD79B1